MALPDSVKYVEGTAIVLADTTDYTNPKSMGARTDQIDLTSVADSAYRQGAKIDLGANRAPLWRVQAALEFAATPTDGEAVYFYLGWSVSGTAATANPAGLSGSDAAYTGYSSDADDAVKQLVTVLSAPVVDSQITANVQIMDFGTFSPLARYACPLFRNESGAALHSDAVEHCIVLTPIETQIQD